MCVYDQVRGFLDLEWGIDVQSTPDSPRGLRRTLHYTRPLYVFNFGTRGVEEKLDLLFYSSDFEFFEIYDLVSRVY